MGTPSLVTSPPTTVAVSSFSMTSYSYLQFCTSLSFWDLSGRPFASHQEVPTTRPASRRLQRPWLIIVLCLLCGFFLLWGLQRLLCGRPGHIQWDSGEQQERDHAEPQRLPGPLRGEARDREVKILEDLPGAGR